MTASRRLVVFFTLCVCFVVLYVCFSDIQGFWFDELFSIGVVREGVSFKDLIYTYVTSETTNPPLYDIVLFFLYRFLPKNEAWLLSVNALFWMIGTFLISLLAEKKTENPTAPFIVLAFSGISVFLINNAVWELRSYALLYMLASLVQFLFFKAKEHESSRNLLFLGLAMVLLAFTHYFGDIVIFCYGLMDLILFIRKKVTLKCLLPYIMCIATMGPYLILTIRNSPGVAEDFWILPPSAYDVLDTYVTLLGNKYSLIISVVALICMIAAMNKGGKIDEKEEAAIASFFVIFVLSAIVFAYSRFINPRASIWTARYFIAIVPSVIFCATVSLSLLPRSISRLTGNDINKKGLYEWILVFIMIIFMICGSHNNLKLLFTDDIALAPDNINIRRASELMKKESKNKDKDVLVVTTLRNNYLEGWKEFYVKDTDLRIINANEVGSNELEGKTVYLFFPHGRIPEMDIEGTVINSAYGGRLIELECR